MAFRPQLKLDMAKWSNNPTLHQFTKQLNGYEKRVSTFVKDFDLKSREARERSRKQLDKFLSQLKKTRNNVEKKVTLLVNKEGQRLNKGLNELFVYLKAVSQKEKTTKRAGKSSKAKGKKTTTTKRSKTSTRSKASASSSSQPSA